MTHLIALGLIPLSVPLLTAGAIAAFGLLLLPIVFGTFTLSTAVRMKIYYDNAAGTLVDITSICLSVNDIDVQGVIEGVTPFGVAMKVFIPTGRGEFMPITIGGLFKLGDNKFNDLFADRVPEDPDTATRTFKIDWTGEGVETTSVETYLKSYKRQPNNDNGLTRAQVDLQPTGEITETTAT